MMMKKSWYILAKKPAFYFSPAPRTLAAVVEEREVSLRSSDGVRSEDGIISLHPTMRRFYRCMQPVTFLCMYILWDTWTSIITEKMIVMTKRDMILGYVVMLAVITTSERPP